MTKVDGPIPSDAILTGLESIFEAPSDRVGLRNMSQLFNFWAFLSDSLLLVSPKLARCNCMHIGLRQYDNAYIMSKKFPNAKGYTVTLRNRSAIQIC